MTLAERGVATVLLEAAEPGAGASGRNGGQVIPGLRHFVEDLTAVYGDDLGTRLHAWGAGTADATFALVRRLGLDCDANQAGWINAAKGTVEGALVRRRAEAGCAGTPPCARSTGPSSPTSRVRRPTDQLVQRRTRGGDGRGVDGSGEIRRHPLLHPH